MADSSYLFTSESVSDGHPDKVADQISDAILDAFMDRHKEAGVHGGARMACETLIKDNMVVLAGEYRCMEGVLGLSSKELEDIVKRVLCWIGYSRNAPFDVGCYAEELEIINRLGPQSDNIHDGVDGKKKQKKKKELGAGDQGLMFGYACDDEPKTRMPAPIHLAHSLMRKHREIRYNSGATLLGPDAKCQVTMRYRDGQPVSVHKIVLSTQHKKGGLKAAKKLVKKEIINPVVEASDWDWRDENNPRILVNPCGPFEIGGPAGDCGLTGRKIIVDTYGGMARHGGGAFSGKDPSKVDRSASYMARYIAKNVVAAGLAKRCEIQVSYVIGKPDPLPIMINTFSTGHDQDIRRRVEELGEKDGPLDLRPRGLIKKLQLENPARVRYRPTAAFGHFGREAPGFTWEQTDVADLLKSA